MTKRKKEKEKKEVCARGKNYKGRGMQQNLSNPCSSVACFVAVFSLGKKANPPPLSLSSWLPTLWIWPWRKRHRLLLLLRKRRRWRTAGTCWASRCRRPARRPWWRPRPGVIRYSLNPTFFLCKNKSIILHNTNGKVYDTLTLDINNRFIRFIFHEFWWKILDFFKN